MKPTKYLKSNATLTLKSAHVNVRERSEEGGMEDEIRQKRERRKGREGGHIERVKKKKKNCCFVSRFGLVLVHLSTTLHQIETG